MKNENSTYTKWKKSNRKYTFQQICEGVGIGIALTGFAASQKGAFRNINSMNVEMFAKNIGQQALNFYKEIGAKCNPQANIPSYVFLSLAGGLIILIIRGKLLKRNNNKETIKTLVDTNASLAIANSKLSENKGTPTVLTKKKVDNTKQNA